MFDVSMVTSVVFFTGLVRRRPEVGNNKNSRRQSNIPEMEPRRIGVTQLLLLSLHQVSLLTSLSHSIHPPTNPSIYVYIYPRIYIYRSNYLPVYRSILLARSYNYIFPTFIWWVRLTGYWQYYLSVHRLPQVFDNCLWSTYYNSSTSSIFPRHRTLIHYFQSLHLQGRRVYIVCRLSVWLTYIIAQISHLKCFRKL